LKPNQSIQNINKQSFRLLVPITSILIIGVTSLEMQRESKNDLLLNLSDSYNLKQGKWVNNEVFKINTKDKLIYIKTISHNPLICWTGDGYSILNQKKVSFKNEIVWKNEITKNNKYYQSIWWYECDNKKYTSSIKVMLMKLRYNKPVRLINEVTEISVKTKAQ
jgi:exosortase N